LNPDVWDQEFPPLLRLALSTTKVSVIGCIPPGLDEAVDADGTGDSVAKTELDDNDIVATIAVAIKKLFFIFIFISFSFPPIFVLVSQIFLLGDIW
jgi:hypothetical protein